MKTKIAIVGSSGFIASKIIPEIKSDEIEIITIGRSSEYVLELDDPEKFDYNILSDVDFVIFIAAISSPDLCEKEFDKCWNVNVKGTEYFIRKSLDSNCKVIFFSSDAVYGKDSGIAFDENSEHYPTTQYGKMKNEIEMLFNDNSNFFVFRLAYVFSLSDKFTKYILQCAKDDKEPEIFHPFYRNVICIDILTECLLYVIKNFDSIPYKQINLAGPELMSRVKIVDSVYRATNTSLKYNIIEMPESFKECRPLITETKSIYLPSIIKNYYNSFESRVLEEIERSTIK